MPSIKTATALLILHTVFCSHSVSDVYAQSACGRRLVKHQGLITLGSRTRDGDWPWTAAIYHISDDIARTSSYKCGGTILNSNTILTAAHCLYENGENIVARRVLVHLGKYNLLEFGLNTQELQVSEVVLHSNFNPTNYDNDIAIIRLSTHAILNDYMQPICLWNSNKIELSEVVNKVGIVTGWGLTERFELSDILLQAPMRVVSAMDCLYSNRDFYGTFLSDKVFCAGFRNGTGACNGDSGGALVFEQDGVYRIRGIVSLTAARLVGTRWVCNSTQYVIFTDVAQHLPWIEENVPELFSSTTTTSSPISPKQRISATKCNEYKEFGYDTLYVSNILKDTPNEKKFANCDFASYIPAANSTEAKIREFPHMAAIGYVNSSNRNKSILWLCGGSLISEEFVLSAAYCVTVPNYGDANHVRLGEYQHGRSDDPTILLEIIERIPHPEYQGSHYNDISLFKVDRKVMFNAGIRPVCLPAKSNVPETAIIATGWGSINYRGRKSDVLMKVNLEMFSQSECRHFFSNDGSLRLGILEESQICVGSHSERKDTCLASNGGQLQVDHENYQCSYTLIGVASYGAQCGVVDIPGVYTRIYPYLDWIENVVWPNENYVGSDEVIRGRSYYRK